MEAFSLLKYWRGGGGGGGGGVLPLAPSSSDSTPNSSTTTILTAVAQNENTIETDDDNDDEGPFFDLEFTVPDEPEGSEDFNENPNSNSKHEESEEEEEEEESDDDDDDDGEREFKIRLSPSTNDRSDGNLSLSPSAAEDLFFKGKLVEVEPSSFVLNPSSEPNSKPQVFTSSLLKSSATKFRVFMLGLKKPKPEPENITEESSSTSSHKKKQRPQRIKFKVEEVPIVSLFTRDNSSKGNNKTQTQKQNAVELPSEEKRLSKEVVMQKYLKMVKPLYIRVSRRYGEKLGQHRSTSEGKSAVTATTVTTEEEVAVEGETVVAESAGNNVKRNQKQKQGNLPAGLRVVYKHLGKSRSASSAVAASPPAAVSSKRRDDSLLQQQDGIQGAILHCKRSFNASRDQCESSQLPRSVSDPLREILPELSRKSNDKRLSLKKEQKDKSFQN